MCENLNVQIPFDDDEINLIYQFGEQSKEETCNSLAAIVPQIKDSTTKQIVSTTLKRLNALPEDICVELTATTKRRKMTEHEHSIKTRLEKARKQQKEQTVSGEKTQRTERKGKA